MTLVQGAAAVGELRDRYAELAVRLGLNLNPGQDVVVWCQVAHVDLARALTRAAYDAGAAHVAVIYADAELRRAAVERAPESALGWSHPQLVRWFETFSDTRPAMLRITNEEPGVFDNLEPRRVGLSQERELHAAWFAPINSSVVNWTEIAGPTERWAERVFGTPDVEQLWQAVASAVRLYEADPILAWRSHLDRLHARAKELNDRRVDTVRFRGPNTDLIVGLSPRSTWTCCGQSPHGCVENIPTEEVFTTPHRFRTEGTVRATRPLVIRGALVRDLELRFEHGRIVQVTASAGKEIVEADLGVDEGARYLGELALVDRTSAVARTGLLFWTTLLDENASCHLAYGQGFPVGIQGAEGATPDELESLGLNNSSVHTDFMIGGHDIEVDGVMPDGSVLPLLRDDTWQL